MKNLYLIIILSLLMSFLLLPLMAVDKTSKGETDSKTKVSSAAEKSAEKSDEFRVKFKETGKTETLDAKEYLLGVLAAEMPAEYNSEALKAGAVAAYTYAVRKRALNTAADYDVTDDPALDQSYITKNKRAEKWGSKAEEYEKKLAEIIAAVEGEVVLYQGEPILAAYHSVSSGNTESAKNVWGTDYPYLQSVPSVGDLLAPDFLSEETFSKTEFDKIITSLNCKTLEKGADYIGTTSKSDAGTVLSIEICGTKLTGSDIREAFGLRSAAFDLVYREEKFTFTVTGYGHLVGMSQYGAHYLAEQGSGYKDILLTYYKGCSVENLS